ncbi:MAG: hypothetical protein JWL81_1565 [Verrucomicrobiales bacterium]|nr:hypothetical protein [Verrucomicrobiales bacterium]
MSKAKQNTFLTGYFAILAASAAGLGYLAWSTWSTASEAKETYQSKTAKLATLQKAPIFPKQENVDAKKKQVDAYADQVGKLNEALRGFQAPLADKMNNSEFQTKLQATRDSLATEAKNAGVKLPENFDIGMGIYLSTFPETKAVPRLNAWLEGIDSFLKILINGGVKEINIVSRPELPFEKKEDGSAATPAAGKTPAKPATPAKPTAAKGKAGAAAEPVAVLDEKAVIERYPFNVTFTCSNRSLNEVLTALANTPGAAGFFNIRSLRVENEQKTGAETSAQIQVVEENDPVTQKPFKRDAVYIFGVEKVQVHLAVDLIRFAGPEMAEAKK